MLKIGNWVNVGCQSLALAVAQCCSRFCAQNSIDMDGCDTKDTCYYQFHQSNYMRLFMDIVNYLDIHLAGKGNPQRET